MRERLKKILPGLISLLIVLAAAEGTAKIFPGILPDWMRTQQWIASATLEYYSGRFFVPGLGVVLKPNIRQEFTGYPDFAVDYQTIELGQEKVGIRDRAIPPDPWGAAFGDSFTEGAAVQLDELWVKTLEKDLGRPVVNCGESSFTTNQYAAMLERTLRYVHPKVVLVMAYENDFRERMLVRSLDEPPYRSEGWRITSHGQYADKWLIKHSFLYKLVRLPYLALKNNRRKIWNALRGQREAKPTGPGVFKHREGDLDIVLTPILKSGEVITNDWESPEWAESSALVEKDLRDIRELARKNGARLLVLYAPGKEQAYSHLLETRYPVSKQMDLPNRQFAAFCKKLGIEFLDLTEPFRQQARAGRQLYWKWDGHWNAEGNALVSGLVLDWLKKKAWI